MRLYLAGPMTGIPQFNFPAFDEAASNLRMVLGGDGVDVVSPAEIDDPATRAAALASKDGAPGSGTTSGETWGDFLSRDVKLVADEVDAIMVLPGWEDSKGARLEVFVARSVGKPVYDYDRWSKYDSSEGEAHKFDPVEEFDRWMAGCRVEGLPVFELNDLYLASVIGKVTSFETDEGCVSIRGRLDDPALIERIKSRDAGMNVEKDEYGATRVTSETGGQKGQKDQRMGLIPPEFLLALSEVYGMGAKKYDDHNYLKGYDWSLSIDALLRHLMAFQSGEDTDPESGLPHILHVAWHCATLFMFDEHGLGTDDRLFHTIEKNAADRDAKESAEEFFRRDRPDVDLLG